MILAEAKKLNLPDSPGVYFFVREDEGKEILYVGKATSLRDRVLSYFKGDIVASRGTRIKNMVRLATVVKFQKTDSVLEALILESEEIKKRKPRYNAREKDDKSYYFVVITREDFPRVLLRRGRNLPEKEDERKKVYRSLFGPYPYPSEVKQALKIIRKIFPYRDNCIPNSSHPYGIPKGGQRPIPRGKPCFNRQIGLCPGVCTGEMGKREYARLIKRLELFFSGKKQAVIGRINREMSKAAQELHFEEAGRLKRELSALSHIEDVALIKKREEAGPGNLRIEAYDIAHISGTNTVGAMTVVVGGEPEKKDYKRFKIKRQEKNDDVGNLSEVLERRFSHFEWPLPDLVVIDGGLGQLNAAKKILASYKLAIPIVAVVKDEKHKPKKIIGDTASYRAYQRAILIANVEAHRFAISYHRKLRDTPPH